VVDSRIDDEGRVSTADGAAGVGVAAADDFWPNRLR